MREKNKKKIEKGARNLVVLGALSTVVALTTTGVALAIYHNSGDIYLDRSRPGFLPDEEEIQQDEGEREDDDYVFQKDTVLDTEKMDEFLEELQEEIDAINAYEKPFGEEVLSDERLGIPKTESAAGKNE